MKKLAILVAVLILLTATGCSRGSAVARTQWNIGSGSRSFSEELTFNTQGHSFQRVTLEIDVKLTAGTINWTAYDPHGNLIFSESTQNKYRKTTKFDPIPGEWKLVIEAVNVSGEMEFLWRGKK